MLSMHFGRDQTVIFITLEPYHANGSMFNKQSVFLTYYSRLFGEFGTFFHLRKGFIWQ